MRNLSAAAMGVGWAKEEEGSFAMQCLSVVLGTGHGAAGKNGERETVHLCAQQ